VLKPVLEKLADEYAGAFILAKVDTEREPELAARFGIRGIPNVKAFSEGRVVSEFSGAQPEQAVRAFLSRIIPTPGEKLRRAAAAQLRTGENATAESKLREALALEPENRPARLDLAELLLARGAYPEAERELEAIPPREREERAEELARRIEVWNNAQALPSVAELEARIGAAPADLQARFELAERLAAEQRYEGALEQLLEVVRGDRGELRERARKMMVDVFGFAGADADFVPQYRRLLSSALY
jgi:putative thioredoxin